MENLNEQIKRMQRIAGIEPLNEDQGELDAQEPGDMFDAAEQLGRDGLEDWLNSHGVSQTHHLDHPSELWLNSWYLSDDGNEIFVRRNSLKTLVRFIFDETGSYESTEEIDS